MNQKIKIQNINLGHKIIIYFLFVGMTLTLMTSSAYCIIDLRISPTISPEEGELNLDRLKMEIAGEFFGIDISLILSYRQEQFRPEDIVTALFFSGDSQRPLDSILALRQKEEDWSRVATILEVPPNAHGMQMALTHGKGKKVGLKRKLASESDIFISFISDYYKIDMERLWLYFEREFTINDILLAVNLGTHYGIRFESLLQDRERGLDWFTILRERNIKEEKLFLPYKSEIKYKNKPVLK
ncbi:MAG: hypothetical protein IMZ56_00335 [Candidatus Atribacteria bacterium]|nr:hypothetical protein [Candidatus Atribacteria bacterium]